MIQVTTLTEFAPDRPMTTVKSIEADGTMKSVSQLDLFTYVAISTINLVEAAGRMKGVGQLGILRERVYDVNRLVHPPQLQTENPGCIDGL